VFKDSVRTAKETHCISVMQTSQLMLYSEIIAVCSEIHTQHINALCGQNVKFLNVKHGGTYSNHWAFISKPYFRLVKHFNPPFNFTYCNNSVYTLTAIISKTKPHTRHIASHNKCSRYTLFATVTCRQYTDFYWEQDCKYCEGIAWKIQW
jgi:hypothetical protein